ncbi:MAG: Por secretion system C-terminal sorting protein [Bryobacterales bacterium]|nr:Por secretion system C-terminal sorting protein [Bryobacterales bacterium]
MVPRWVVTGRLVVCLFAAAPAVRANPITLSTLELVGTAQLLSPTVLRLTPNFETNPTGDPPAGAAWTHALFNVADPFAVSFGFRMSDPTGQPDPADGSAGDGIAFVIQNDFRGTSAIGRGAGGMGFMGIFDSVAVMFDTYQNNYAYGDPNGNYIAVNTRGTDFNVPHHFCTDGQLTTNPQLPPDLPGVTCTSNPTLGMTGVLSPLLDDGAIHHALIFYSPGTLTVYLDSVPVLTVALNLANVLSLQNGTSAYLGFTAGTRFSYQNQDILDFSFTPVPEPATAAACVAGLAILAVLGQKRKRSAAN